MFANGIVFLILLTSAFAETTHNTATINTSRVTNRVSLKEFLNCSTLGEVIRANDNRMPRNIQQWTQALERFGSVQAAFIPFSRSPNSSSLSRPRVILSVQNRWGEHAQKKAQEQTNIMDRLLVAITFNPDGSQTTEFITHSQSPLGYRFGVIGDSRKPGETFKGHDEISGNCFSCHKNHGPIFPDAPWSDTDEMVSTKVAMLQALSKENPRVYEQAMGEMERLSKASKTNFELAEKIRTSKILQEQKLIIAGEDTGLKFLQSDSGAVDSRVRAAAEYNFLLAARKDPRGRKILSLGFKGLAATLLETDFLIGFGFSSEYQGVLQEFKETDLTSVPELHSSVLADYNPILQRAIVPDNLSDEPNALDPAEIRKIFEYSAMAKTVRQRELPDKVLPSGTGFDRSLVSKVGFRNKNSLKSVDGYRFLLGITDKDLSVMNSIRDQLGPEVMKKLTPIVLSDPVWKRLFSGEVIPNRTMFMETMVGAVQRAALGLGRKIEVTVPSYSEERSCSDGETAAVSSESSALSVLDSLQSQAPTDSCYTCHMTPPTPSFPFDPEDRDAWQSWLKDPLKKAVAQKWKEKILERLRSTTRPMPPKDSPEDKSLSRSRKQSLMKFLQGLP